jgi:hypothetical protein
VVAAKANVYSDRQEAIDPVAKANLEAFAKATGYSEAEYHSDGPAAPPAGRGAGARGAGPAAKPSMDSKPADAKPATPATPAASGTPATPAGPAASATSAAKGPGASK